MIIIKKESQNTSNWSGGKTTELYIHPKGSKYNLLDFDFRISSAIVEVEESTFTSLPGVERVIMVLEGELELSHENEYSKTIKPFETDSFKGDWKTTSKGKVIDFNLMTRDGSKGCLSHQLVTADQTITIDNSKTKHIAIYVVNGEININFENNTHILTESDIIIFENNEDTSGATITCSNSTNIVISEVM